MRIKSYLFPYLKDLIIDIVHVGSTSVEGLAAKPIIDFVIIIESYEIFPELVQRLNTLGYEHEGDGGIGERECFKRNVKDDFMQYHMYVCPKDSLELKRQIMFRDYLNMHEDAKCEYAALKESLAERFRHDIDSYVDGKHEFIENILKMAQEEDTNGKL